MMFAQCNTDLMFVEGVIQLSEGQIFKRRESLIEGELDDEVKLKLKVFSSFTRCKNPFKDSMQQKKNVTIQFSLLKRNNWFQPSIEQNLLTKSNLEKAT